MGSATLCVATEVKRRSAGSILLPKAEAFCLIFPAMQSEASAPIYKRVVIKLSGEALREPGARENISPQIVRGIADCIKGVRDLGVETSVVVGGGNIWRGLSAANRGMDRTTADYMGMLATVINGLALKSVLDEMGVQTRVQTAIAMENVAEPFILGRARRHLEVGRVVIFVAGHRQSILLHRHDGGIARERDSRGCDFESDEGGRRLRFRSEEESGRETLRPAQLH